jgi:Integral peroxisomal membrane peroxin
MSPQSLSDSLAPVQSLRFLFTIYENQRWWMGLDWTAALLPAERPSWCSAAQLPIPPPNAFTLPENTTIYLPDANGNRMRRTAIWKWEEPEWRVLVRRDGGNLGLTRVERPLSAVKDEAPNSSRFLKVTTGKGGLPGSEIPKNATFGNVDDDYVTPDSEETADEDPFTDPDGWVYGDNKWENQSNRGVMGKVSVPFMNHFHFLLTFYIYIVHTVPKMDTDCGCIRNRGT